MNKMAALVLVLLCCWTATVRCLPQLNSLASLTGVPPGFPSQTTSRKTSPGPPHRLLNPVSRYLDSSVEGSLDISDNTLISYPPYDLRQRLRSGLDRPSTLQLYAGSDEDFSDYIPPSILDSLRSSGTRRGNKPVKLLDSSNSKNKQLYFLLDKYGDSNIDSALLGERGGRQTGVRQANNKRGQNEESLTFSLLVESPERLYRSPWNRLSSFESNSREASPSGTLTAALAARQGGINVDRTTVDQILNLPEPTVRAVFGRSKKDILERLLGLDSDEFNINDIRSNPAVLRSLRGMSLAKALDILRRDDDDYDPLRLRRPYGHHLGDGHNHLGSDLYNPRYRDDRYYDGRYNTLDEDSYSLGSFLPLTGAAAVNKSYLFTFIVVFLQMLIFK